MLTRHVGVCYSKHVRALNEIRGEFHSNFWHPLSAQELKHVIVQKCSLRSHIPYLWQNRDIFIFIYLFRLDSPLRNFPFWRMTKCKMMLSRLTLLQATIFITLFRREIRIFVSWYLSIEMFVDDVRHAYKILVWYVWGEISLGTSECRQ